MADFTAPKVRVGDTILYYSDPFSDSGKPYLGWVLSEGVHNDAINLLVFTDVAGFTERIAIRHRDNPVLREKPTLASMGGWDLSEQTKDLQKLSGMKIAAMAASEKAAIRPKTSK